MTYMTRNESFKKRGLSKKELSRFPEEGETKDLIEGIQSVT